MHSLTPSTTHLFQHVSMIVSTVVIISVTSIVLAYTCIEGVISPGCDSFILFSKAENSYTVDESDIWCTFDFPGFQFSSFWKLENQWKPMKTQNIICHFADVGGGSIDDGGGDEVAVMGDTACFMSISLCKY